MAEVTIESTHDITGFPLYTEQYYVQLGGTEYYQQKFNFGKMGFFP